jgi:hypothetical protein
LQIHMKQFWKLHHAQIYLFDYLSLFYNIFQ